MLKTYYMSEYFPGDAKSYETKEGKEQRYKAAYEEYKDQFESQIKFILDNPKQHTHLLNLARDLINLQPDAIILTATSGVKYGFTLKKIYEHLGVPEPKFYFVEPHLYKNAAKTLAAPGTYKFFTELDEQYMDEKVAYVVSQNPHAAKQAGKWEHLAAEGDLKDKVMVILDEAFELNVQPIDKNSLEMNRSGSIRASYDILRKFGKTSDEQIYIAGAGDWVPGTKIVDYLKHKPEQSADLPLDQNTEYGIFKYPFRPAAKAEIEAYKGLGETLAHELEKDGN